MLELCVCCLLRYADTFWLDSFWPKLPDPYYVVNSSLIGWAYTNSYILVWTVLCLPVACLIYCLTVRLGFSNFFFFFCDFVYTAYHIKLMTELVLETTVFHPYVGAYDTLRFDSGLGVCWRLLNFIRTSWAHNISKFESSPYACWLLNFPYNLWRLGCVGDSWTLSVHFGHKHLQFYSLMTMRVMDSFGCVPVLSIRLHYLWNFSDFSLLCDWDAQWLDLR